MQTKDDTATLPAAVLIVDDDPGARLLMGSALEIAGFSVATAADGASALEAFRARPADCVILDVVMPGMSGFDVCRALRERAGVLRSAHGVAQPRPIVAGAGAARRVGGAPPARHRGIDARCG